MTNIDALQVECRGGSVVEAVMMMAAIAPVVKFDMQFASVASPTVGPRCDCNEVLNRSNS